MVGFYRRRRRLTSVIEKRQSLHRELAEEQCRNRKLAEAIERLEPLANQGSATAMIAHEINNLLTPLSNYAKLALASPEDKVLTSKALMKTAQNCERAGKIMESILALANGLEQERQEAPLPGLLDELFLCLCRDFKKDGITVQIEIPAGLTVYCVAVQIQQVLMNLILNARDAMVGSGGHLTIKAEQTSDAVQIRVSDTGHGIASGDLKEIFDSFFTTKNDRDSSSRPGRGVGLSFCRKVIEAHNGTISVESRPNEGTTFLITLPRQH